MVDILAKIDDTQPNLKSKAASEVEEQMLKME